MASCVVDIYLNFHLVIQVILLVVLICFQGGAIQAFDGNTIEHYRENSFIVSDKSGKIYAATRTFTINKKPKILIVDPNTLETKVVNQNEMSIASKKISNTLLKTPYKKMLTTFTSPPYALENYGVNNAPAEKAGVFLTIDMCPSSKPFEEKFFQSLATNKQVPIAISMTGVWATKHPAEFDWLIQQRRANRLNITWINHSYHHHYHATTPINKHFLSTLNHELLNDVLSLEKLLIQKGEVPSVFFRFPGLIASQHAILELRRLGLIPIAANAWLAKGQRAKPGSIILIHGNSNEHEGIKKILRLFEDKPGMKLLPLNQLSERKDS